MKRISLVVVITLLIGLLVGGCGYPASIELEDFSSNGAGFSTVKLMRKGEKGTTYVLSGKSTAPKDGQAKVTLSLDTEKGKEKTELAFDVKEGKGIAFGQEVTTKSKVKSITAKTFMYEPYEFTAKDYPQEPNTKLIYYAEKQVNPSEDSPPVSVGFNLEGPWDLTQGPTEGEIVYNYVAPKETENMADFPEATNARKSSNPSSASTYYYKKDPGGIQMLGIVNKSLLSEVSLTEKYSPPDLTYKTPFKVGDSWESINDVVYSGLASGTGRSETKIRVVARNSVKVPQGEYDTCYLLQYRYHNKDFQGTVYDSIEYAWLVPGVGSVAYIDSVNGEQNELFSQASDFWRLKFKGQAKPGL